MPLDRKRVAKEAEKRPDQPKQQQNFAGKSYNQQTGYANYLSDEKISKLIQQKIAYSGILEVQPTNYSAGSVKTEIGTLLLPVRLALNRALPGDEVVVLPLAAEESESAFVNWKISGAQKGADVTTTRSKTEANVVFISQSLAPKVFEALLDQQQRNPQVVRFQPIDRRYPAVDVPNTFGADLPKPNEVFKVEITEWVQQNMFPTGKIIEKVREISLDSLDNIADYVMQASGIPYNYRDKELAEVTLSEIKAAEQQLLDDTKLPRSQVFALDQAVLLDLQKQLRHLNQQQPAFDAQKRRNFVDDLVFTIDPDTAKDFDDSTHINFIAHDGKIVSFMDFCAMSGADQVQFKKFFRGYEVGVHIADVTHYVKQDSPLDLTAQTTTTSVYITDRCCPMLPFQLADGLCSLNPAVPRYTYSLVFQLSPEGELLPQKVWFGRGVICSHARLDYVCAQRFIDNNFTQSDVQETCFFNQWACAKGYQQAVILAVQEMNKIALCLRDQRKKLGSLMMSADELRWRVNQDLQVSINPPEEAGHAHHLIEEFMVIANSLIAMRLVASFPSCATLRQHPPPKAQFEFAAGLSELKYPPIDLSGGVALLKSLENLSSKLQQVCSKKVGTTEYYNTEQYFQFLATNFFMSNGLTRAKYIAGMSENTCLMAHWGIHSQLYMHFTSPIRRYADDVCHRLLTAALEIENKLDKESYRNSALFAYIPHCLEFKEKVPIYSYDKCLPPVDFQKLCDKIQPLEDMEETVQKQDQSSGVVNMLDDIQDGKVVDLRKNKHKQRLIKAIDMIVENGQDFFDQVQQHKAYESINHEDVNKESHAYKALEAVNKSLAENTQYSSIDQLRFFLNKCNEMAKLTQVVEELHHKIMLRFFVLEQIKKKQVDHIEAKAFLISIKNCTALFVIPEFGISFDMNTEVSDMSTKSEYALKMDRNISFQEQKIDDATVEVAFTLLKPFSVKLLPGNLVTDGILVYYNDV